MLLKLSFRFQTFESFSRKVPHRKHINTLIITKKTVCPFNTYQVIFSLLRFANLVMLDLSYQFQTLNFFDILCAATLYFIMFVYLSVCLISWALLLWMCLFLLNSILCKNCINKSFQIAPVLFSLKRLQNEFHKTRMKA